MPFSDIVSIEKRMTAFVIPNAIQIATLHAKHTFSSFISRDATYELIVNIWKLSHPSLPKNNTLEDLDLSDEDEAAPTGEEDTTKTRMSKRAKLRRKFLAAGRHNDDDDDAHESKEATEEKEGETKKEESKDKESPSGGSGKKAAHKPTSCPCDKDKAHYPSVVLDTVYPAKPEKIYNLLFTSGFMKDFWTGNQKLLGE